MTITYKGKTFTTQFYRDLTDDEYYGILEEYYHKPSDDEVFSEFYRVVDGGVKTADIYKRYFKDIASDVVMQGDKWSINEVLQSRELTGFFVAKGEASPRVTDSYPTLCKKFETMIRVGGKSVCRKATQFPLKVAKQVIGDYCSNGNYYDFSCGWGIRLLAALVCGCNYYGTDPNDILVERLNDMYGDFCRSGAMVDVPVVDIRCQGSEVFVPEWEGTMGLCFSSPPYFDLEDYRHGEQSIKTCPTYKQWLRDYVCPTIRNCRSYLTADGVLAFNIKNTNKYKMLDDFISIVQYYGFVVVDEIELRNGKRVFGSVGDEKNTVHINNTDEVVCVCRQRH